MRSLIRSRIITDPEILAAGIVPEGVLAGQVDTPPMRPFINLIWGDTNEGLSVVKRRLVTAWVHDQPGDFARIDRLLFRLRAIMTAIEATAWTEEGGQSGYITAVTWGGDSGDLTDDGHGTIVRTGSFTIIGSGL